MAVHQVSVDSVMNVNPDLRGLLKKQKGLELAAYEYENVCG